MIVEKQTRKEEATSAYKDTQYILRRIIPPEFYYQLRTFNRQFTWMFLPFARWRWQRWRKKHNISSSTVEPAAPYPFDKNTEIVIEAYPRCGNTFAQTAFKFSQDKPVTIAHHTHAAAQVIAGARKKVPTLVIIRPPEDAIVSYLIGDFDPGLTMKQALKEYISFYETILPYSDLFVLATFEELISDFGIIIGQINSTYSTNFKKFNHTPENAKKCFALIDKGYQNAFGRLSNKVVSRPSQERQKWKQQLRQDFYKDDLKKLRRKAEQIYNELTANK